MALPQKTALTNSNKPLLFFLLIFIATSTIAYLLNPTIYNTILGDINPMIFFTASSVVAYLSLIYIDKFEWHFIDRQFTINRSLYYISISMLLGLMPVLIDIWQPFPRDINVLFPDSIIFYPTIGVAAEIIFHLIPLVILILIFKNRLAKLSWVFIIIPAAVEPTFQIMSGNTLDMLSLKDMLIFLEILIFSIVQMRTFMKFGFIAMYICRLGFYLTWHFVWGELRLELL